MSGTSPAADTTSATQPAVLTQADIDKAAATAGTAAAAAERARTTGILTHAEAAGRTALAHQCVASGLSVEAAGALMAAAPKAAAASPLAAAMAALGNPKVEGIEAAATELAVDDPKVIASAWDKALSARAPKRA